MVPVAWWYNMLRFWSSFTWIMAWYLDHFNLYINHFWLSHQVLFSYGMNNKFQAHVYASNVACSLAQYLPRSILYLDRGWEWMFPRHVILCNTYYSMLDSVACGSEWKIQGIALVNSLASVRCGSNFKSVVWTMLYTTRHIGPRYKGTWL